MGGGDFHLNLGDTQRFVYGSGGQTWGKEGTGPHGGWLRVSAGGVCVVVVSGLPQAACWVAGVATTSFPVLQDVTWAGAVEAERSTSIPEVFGGGV